MGLSGATISMLTLQGIPREAQLANDVAGNVTFNPLSLFGMTLSCFQQVVELFRVKLLHRGERQSVVRATSGGCWPPGFYSPHPAQNAQDLPLVMGSPTPEHPETS